MNYKRFGKAAFKWFDFLQVGDTLMGKAESGEVFADYDEERGVDEPVGYDPKAARRF